MDTAFETDAMLNLLTEALRRGPGSPEWHRAVGNLRDLTSPQADEYKLLIAARERIESGRAYREVRAGPAFTRELFGRLDVEPAVDRRISLGLFVRLLCLLTLVGAIGVVTMYAAQAKPHDAERLSGRLFVTPVRSWTFASLPRDLRHVGPLSFETRGGNLRAGGRDTTEPASGLLYAPDALDLAGGTCVELRIDYKPGPSTVQLVLLQDEAGGGPPGAATRELSLSCDASGVRLNSPAASTAPRSLPAGPHLLRIKVVGDAAIAEIDGQVLWSGTQTLGPRGVVGVRMIRNGRAGDVTVQSLRVLAP